MIVQEIAWYVFIFLCFSSIGKAMALWGKKESNGVYGWANVWAGLLMIFIVAVIAGKFGAI